jgi:hypothetical protein
MTLQIGFDVFLNCSVDPSGCLAIIVGQVAISPSPRYGRRMANKNVLWRKIYSITQGPFQHYNPQREAGLQLFLIAGCRSRTSPSVSSIPSRWRCVPATHRRKRHCGRLPPHVTAPCALVLCSAAAAPPWSILNRKCDGYLITS